MTPPLRILHLNSLLTGGGTDDQCVKLVSVLRTLGLEASLAGPDGREFSRIIREAGIPFESTGNEGPLKLALILRSARLIRRNGAQIVHGHHGRDLWPTILAARLSGVRPKIALTRHLAKSPSSWASRRFLLGQCDVIVAVSEFVAKVLREGAYEPESPEPERRRRPPLQGDHSKIIVIHGGIDTNRFQPLPADDPRPQSLRREWGLEPHHTAFAVVGGYQLPRGKGQREFLQAAARIHAQTPDARFLMVGRGNMAEVLRADIEQLGLTGKARLTPYCTDMPAAMNAIDCLVHPAVGTEAFPGVVLEAFCCGKPVIASALDGIPEAFAMGAHGLLVKPEDVGALANAMGCWKANRGSDASRAELHRKVSASVSLDAAAGKMASLYRRLLGVPQ